MKIFTERPVATAMLFSAALALGIYSFLNTPLELAPNEDYPQIDILTSWAGVSPEVIQTRITSPLEELFSAVKGVRKITSQSHFGMSRITLEVSPKANMDLVYFALREEIVKAETIFPFGVRPIIQTWVPEDFRIQPFFVCSISGDYPLQRLFEMVKDKLEYGIGSVRNVAKAQVTGAAKREFRVILDRKKLGDLNIHPYQVRTVLAESLHVFPVGGVKKAGQEYLFRLSPSMTSARDLGELIISNSGAFPIRLGDVAHIISFHADIPLINRINGRPTVKLTVLKEKGSHSLRVAKDVKKKINLISKELPQDLVIKVVHDESEEIKKNLFQLYRLAGIVILIVFTLIFAVLRRLVPSFLILSSLAFSLVITFNVIHFFRLSLNLLTLGTLALGFGLFVGDAIVVFENILRLREKGLSPLQSALQGSKEVFVSVLASTLTVVSAFLCFPFFEGRLKIYYLPLAAVMSAALSASLLVSFSLIPALSPSLMKLPCPEQNNKPRRVFERAQRFLLRHPAAMAILVLAILYGSYKWFRSEVGLGEFLRWYSQERLSVNIEMPPGTDIRKTDDVAREFETTALKAKYAKEIDTTVSPDAASILISFPARIERSSRPYELKERLIRLASQFAGIGIQVAGFDSRGYSSHMGTALSHNSRIKFFGYNLKKLKEITSELEQRLRSHPRIKGIKTISSGPGRSGAESVEHVLKIDRDALSRHHIDPGYLFFHLQTLLRGRFEIPLRLFSSGEETELSIKLSDTDEMDLDELQDTLLPTFRGGYLRLGEIFSLARRPIVGSIDRENQQFQQTVMWDFRGPLKAAARFKQAVYAGLRLPPGFRAVPEEKWQMTPEEKTQIKSAVIFSLIIIYVILAALYESFIRPLFIISAVPLGLVGVFLAFVIAGSTFDSSAYVGIILLGGMVVKNAILVVDQIDLKRRQGLPLLDAVLQGTGDRIRPVLMTTSTTVLGVLPMILIRAENGSRQIWSALALCMAGGLVSSAILILIVIPIFCLYGDRAYLRARGMTRRRRGE